MTDQSTPETTSSKSARAATAPASAGTGAGAGAGAGVSRRRLLGTAGATGLVLGAAGAGLGYSAAPAGATPLTSLGADRAMFHGKHQPGITDALQARGHLVAFDLVPGAGRRRPPRCCAAGRRRPSG